LTDEEQETLLNRDNELFYYIEVDLSPRMPEEIIEMTATE
jgi:hypothetical protein